MRSSLKVRWVTGVAALALAGVSLSSSGAQASASAVADFDRAIADAGQPAAIANNAVDLPKEGAQPVRYSSGETNVAMSLPAKGSAQMVEATSVFAADSTDGQVAVQPTSSGFRALVKIESSTAPERYRFDFAGDVSQLSAEADGSVTMIDPTGQEIGTIPAPWAVDGDGREVPTHFVVEGTTLTQVVEHRGKDLEYGIVADPSPMFWAKCAGAVALFIAQNVTPAKLAKAKTILKSAKSTVKYLRKFGSVKSASRHLASFLGSATGVNDLVMRCWPE